MCIVLHLILDAFPRSFRENDLYASVNCS